MHPTPTPPPSTPAPKAQASVSGILTQEERKDAGNQGSPAPFLPLSQSICRPDRTRQAYDVCGVAAPECFDW